MYRYCKHCDDEFNDDHYSIYNRSDTGKLRYDCRLYKNKAKQRRRSANQELARTKERDYYQRTKEAQRAYSRKWYHENQEKEVIRRRILNQTDKYKEMNKLKMRRMRKNINFRIASNLRTRLANRLQGRIKSTSHVKDLGCSLDELKLHLEVKFYSDMSWENYGPIWHIDHIRPLCSFDLTDPEQQKLAVHYTNLQPLLAQDNLSKGGKY